MNQSAMQAPSSLLSGQPALQRVSELATLLAGGLLAGPSIPEVSSTSQGVLSGIL
jgi:hypothetical protein